MAEVLTEPGFIGEDPAETPFVKKAEKLGGGKTRVRLLIKKKLSNPIPKSKILQEPALSKLKIITAPQGTNFALSAEQSQLMDQLIDAPHQLNIW